MDTRVHISLEVKDDDANFRLESPQLHLALVHSPQNNQFLANAGALHYGIEFFSGEHLASWLELAKSSGINPRIEEDVTCCYATGNKFWVADPDNNQWEFWIRTGDVESNDTFKPVQAEKEASCCAPGQCG